MLSQIELVQLADPAEDPRLAEAIALLVIDEIGGYSPDEDEVRTQISAMEGRTTVAAIGDEGQVIATGSLAIGDPRPNEGTIDDVAVAYEYQRASLGRIIMESLEGIANEEGVTRLNAVPRGGTPRRGLVRFYEKLGYQETQEGMTKAL